MSYDDWKLASPPEEAETHAIPVHEVAPYTHVTVEPSQAKAEWGAWVVKISPQTFRFFHNRALAEVYAREYNKSMGGKP